MAKDIKYRLADYDGGLESHPVPESDGQLWLVGSWWELHFTHAELAANGELTDYVLEALPIDKKSCLVSIREIDNDREICCSFVLPHTPAGRFTSDLAARLRELAADQAGIAELGLRQADRDPAGSAAARAFPARMQITAGEQLRIASADATTSSSKLGLQTLKAPVPVGGHYAYEVLAANGRVAALGIAGQAELAWMVCADGSWRLNKRRPLGWELVIESWDGQPVGSYSGRRWLPGGTISLIAGTETKLRRTLGGHWELCTTDAPGCFLDIRMSPSREGLTMILTARSQPPSASRALIATLTACAVLLLQYMSPPVPGATA